MLMMYLLSLCLPPVPVLGRKCQISLFFQPGHCTLR